MMPELKNKSETELNIKEKGDCLMFEPNSLFKRIWGLITILSLVYTATIMPYRIAFIDDNNYPLFIIDTFIDVFFMTDILVNFNTPIHINHEKYDYN